MPTSVEPLSPAHLLALKALLAADAVNNIYLLGLLEEHGVTPEPGAPAFTYYGRFDGPALTAVVFVGGGGGLVVPSSSPAPFIKDIVVGLAGAVKLRGCLGEAEAADMVVRHLGGGRPKLFRTQRLFHVTADDLGPFTNPTLRLAAEGELEQVLPLAVHSVKERLERDPMAEDPRAFRARVRQRIVLRRTYVLPIGERLVFKIDVGSRSPMGAELEGLYTVPEERRRGHATLSLGQISRHLLSSLPRLTLRVDDQDPSLAGVARKVGYLAGKGQRLVLFE